MIRILTGTVLRQLIIGLIFVAGALTAVIWLTQSLRFVDMVLNNGASVADFALLTALLIPKFLLVILPIALFIVVTFFYSKMTADRELVVMSAAGLSPLQLAKPVMLLAGCVVLLTYALNLFFLPESSRMFGELKWQIRNNLSQVLFDEGKFNSVSDSVTIYVRERTSENELLGIFFHDESDTAAPVTIMAKRGSVVKTEQGAQIVMFDGNRQVFSKESKDYSVLYFDRYTYTMERSHEENLSKRLDRREMGLMELFDVRNNPEIAERDHAKYLVEAHKRLILPLQGVAFAALSLVCLFAGGFTRRSQPKRVIAATLIVLTLQITILGVESASAKNIDFIPVLYLIILVPLGAGLLMLRHPPKFDFLN